MLFTSILSALAAATAVQAALPASSSSEKITSYNSTLKSAWTSTSGQGVFTDGLELLKSANGTNSTSTSPIYGVLLRFNETLGTEANGTSSGIPFVALVSCDESATAPLGVSSTNSSATNSTSSTNSTSTTNSTLSSNSTSNATAEVDLFQLAATLDAVAVILYSTANESCTLNSTYNSTTTIPIYSLPAANDANLLLSQFDNVDADHQYFNSTLLIEASANLTGLLSTASSGAVPDTGFLLATISPTPTNNTSPVVATIGRASSASPTSATATGTVPSSTSSPSSPASRAVPLSATTGSAAVLGLAFMMGVWIQM
ncbi:hypothetical protein BCR35DRAFT_300712 [Leucosporidium creatinivorum]|uniref:Uncharacterized protein n=1 Tax=Leucosporidium creatinivorum TaxID=106004 RepID=A0A1Y2G0F6_9BASI|nr:hypothetical protein BCR35DRAFT_300712 [Leucosporidium creatinivorum]